MASAKLTITVIQKVMIWNYTHEISASFLLLVLLGILCFKNKNIGSRKSNGKHIFTHFLLLSCKYLFTKHTLVSLILWNVFLLYFVLPLTGLCNPLSQISQPEFRRPPPHPPLQQLYPPPNLSIFFQLARQSISNLNEILQWNMRLQACVFRQTTS